MYKSIPFTLSDFKFLAVVKVLWWSYLKVVTKLLEICVLLD